MAASTCNKSFCSNYMLINPQESGFLDIFKILFSSNISNRSFVDFRRATNESFGHRWLIFVSTMVQKLMQAAAKPMAGFGAGIEHWLNLVSGNGGLFNLICNAFKGKVMRPDRASASFVSITGNVDKRIELESSIEPGDKRYYAALSVMASKASYENKQYIQSVVNQHWKMDFLGSYDYWNDYQEKATTQAFIMDDKKGTLVVAFRGTEPFDAYAWCSDVDLSWYEIPTMGKVHGGFMNALGLQISDGWPQQQGPTRPETAYYGIRRIIRDHVEKNEKAKYIVTGHSLGGALAALFPAILGLHCDSLLLERLEGVYTFGQPRVGDQEFGNYMKKLMEDYDFKCTRFVYGYDLVPRLPYDDSTQLFKHFGTCIYFNSLYQAKVVDEEPDKNYFSIRWMIPKFVNACWELIRSFVMKYWKGAGYEEGFFLRVVRVMGLFIAGVPAHCFQDYVNCIRLGPSHIFNSAH